MKIGILTYHVSNNYGAVLQAYALYKAISLLNSEVEIIDYRNKKMQGVLTASYSFKGKSGKELIKHIVTLPVKIRERNRFTQFESDNMKLSKESYVDTESLIAKESDYDRIICGSDQVWNMDINGNDTNYFLAFCNRSEKKAAYAPSFGKESNNLDEDEKIHFKELLSQFGFLSVRELQGQNIIQELINITPPVVLDPTMLLSKEQWHEFIGGKAISSSPYILVYTLGESNVDKFALDLSKKTGIRILKIRGSLKDIFNSRIYSVRGIGPSEWINLFLNATYVCTNSFHGIAFSINFNRTFFTELRLPPSRINSRLENILDLFDLRSQLIIDGKNNNVNIPIDWEKVNRKLEEERVKSLNYLRSIVCKE